MATPGINAPPAFLSAPNKPVFDTDFYIEELQIYLVSIGADKFSETRRVAIALNIIGPTCRRIISAASKSLSTVEDVYQCLRKLFPPSVSLTIAREKFNKRVQRPYESTIDFFANISSLAAKCEYGALCDDLVRDKLILGSKNAIKEKLILEQPKTLDSALEIALRIETVQGELAAEIPTEASDQQVNSVQAKEARREKLRCHRCNKMGVKANHPNCKAMGQTCRKCGGKNHFASVCFKSSKNETSVNQVENEKNVLEVYSNFSSHSLMKTVDISCTTANVKTSSNNDSNIVIKFGIDTGSSVNLMPKVLFRESFPFVELNPHDVILKDFSGNVIPVCGFFPVCMRFLSYESNERIYVVNNDRPPLLGIRTFETLNLHTLWDKKVNSIGCVQQFAHEIQLKPNAIPSIQKLRRVPISLRQKVSQELEKLVDNDIIEPVDRSEWVSNVVVVQKASGGIRLCLDLRELNKSIITDRYPLPHTEEVFLKLKDCVLFSVIDLKQAFLQLPLHENSKHFTTFITHEGLYQFKRVPFGLASAPSCFQKVISVILNGMEGVQEFLDDILIGGRTPSEHDARLKEVEKRLKTAGFSINVEKCNIRKSELKFLGHVISKDGICPDPEKIKCIAQAPEPKSPLEIKSFLGMASFYSKYCPNFSSTVEPLLRLTRKDQAWEWTSLQKNAFDEIKAVISQKTALAIFDTSKQTEVHTDASSSGLGAVLVQKDADDNSSIIAFASRTLTAAERNYSVLEKEALAISWAVQRWKVFLWGRAFKIVTDHKPLVSIFSSKDTLQVNLRVARFVMQLLPYIYTIQYRAGSQNHFADFLSRASVSDNENHSTEADNSEELTVNSILSEATLSRDEIAAISRRDPEIQTVKKLLANEPLSEAEKKVVAKFQSVKHELSVVQDILTRGCDRVVLPEAVRQKAIELAHESHQGINRTQDQIEMNYWWPSMHTQIKDFIHNCSTCNQSPKTAKFFDTSVTRIETPSVPWHTLGIDLIGPLNDLPPDCCYALTVMDYHSKYPFIFFTRSITSANIISFLRTLFSLEGLPVRIRCDNGPQFAATEFRIFLKQNDIDLTFSPVYHPRANGLIERWHRTLKHQLQISGSYGAKRQAYISNFLASYRSTPHPETGKSPSFLLHGREMRWTHNPFHNELPPDTMTSTATRCYVRKKFKHPLFHPNEKVRVKLPTGFSTRVVKQKVGNNSYIMTDGKTWHTSKMSKLRDSTHTKSTQLHRQTTPRYPQRNKQAPSRYITQFSS